MNLLSKLKRFWWLIVILLVLASGAGGFLYLSRDSSDSSSNKNTSGSNSQSKTADFRFARFPFDIDDIGSVAPIGEFAGVNRQTAASSHMYGNIRHYVFSKEPGKRAYNVYVPADGEIVAFRNNETTGQFRFNFRISDRAFYYLDHIQSLTPQVLEKLKSEFGSPLRFTQAVEPMKTPVKVKAGEILGQTGLKGIAWDWGVIDQDYCQEMLYPEHYMQDPCPRSAYDFFPDEMKAQIAPLAGYWAAPPQGIGFKKVNTIPVLGHYAHDKAGTLSGGWFQVYKSWENAFLVPDSYEPNALQIRLAIPNLSVFGVWNGLPIGTGKNNPDPKTVTKDSGIVTYNLARTHARDTSEFGILLVRVNADDTITVETIANATSAPAVPTFTAKAVTLKR